MIDYLIIGGGLAGLSFARYCQLYNKSFLILDARKNSASRVAGGMYNPVVLKRFTAIWQSKEQLEIAKDFYPALEKELQTRFFFPMPIYRKFASVEEQNNWFVACDHLETAPFLNEQLFNGKFSHIPSPFGYGEVFETGFLDVAHFVSSYQNYFFDKKQLTYITLDYQQLNISDECIQYNDIKAKNIIFAEGFSLHQNPYFNYLPLDGTKGELLYVKIPDLKLESIVKSKVFLIPVGNDIYKVGATYDWQDKTNVPTQAAYDELIEGLEQLIDCPYEVDVHRAGVRPTVKDRRPLVGKHYQFQNVFLLNGLGTRGVLLAPYLAEKLFFYIEENQTLDKNISVERYYKKLDLFKVGNRKQS